MDTEAPTSRDAALPLPAGLVLLVATGFVDAHTFLAHGHVFAEAMTGNLVLAGIGLVDDSVVASWRPLTSFGLFVVGVAVVWLLERSGRSRVPQVATLGVEVVVLGVAGFLPDAFPDAVVAGAISFAAGLQIAAFDRIGPARFTTVVMTSNSLHAVRAALQALRSRSGRDVRAALRLISGIAAFVVGVVGGALLTEAVGGRAAWVAAGLFLLAGALFVAREPAGRTPGDRPVGSAGPFDG